MTLVDTNVLLDILTGDPVWAPWSLRQLEAAATVGPLIINGIVYAELSGGFASAEELDAFVEGAGLEWAEIPRSALYLAGQAHRSYRARGGLRTSVLPDFLIGAHASVADLPLLTRDGRRYRTYFVGLSLITPLPEH